MRAGSGGGAAPAGLSGFWTGHGRGTGGAEGVGGTRFRPLGCGVTGACPAVFLSSAGLIERDRLDARGGLAAAWHPLAFPASGPGMGAVPAALTAWAAPGSGLGDAGSPARVRLSFFQVPA